MKGGTEQVSREVLELFQTCGTCSSAGGFTGLSPEVPSNPNYSVFSVIETPKYLWISVCAVCGFVYFFLPVQSDCFGSA